MVCFTPATPRHTFGVVALNSSFESELDVGWLLIAPGDDGLALRMIPAWRMTPALGMILALGIILSRRMMTQLLWG